MRLALPIIASTIVIAAAFVGTDCLYFCMAASDSNLLARLRRRTDLDFHQNARIVLKARHPISLAVPYGDHPHLEPVLVNTHGTAHRRGAFEVALERWSRKAHSRRNIGIV